MSRQIRSVRSHVLVAVAVAGLLAACGPADLTTTGVRGAPPAGTAAAPLDAGAEPPPGTDASSSDTTDPGTSEPSESTEASGSSATSGDQPPESGSTTSPGTPLARSEGVADIVPNPDAIRFAPDPDVRADVTARLQAALDQLQPGDVLVLEPGEYRHSAVLTVSVPDVTISGSGAVLMATREERSAFSVAADRVVVEGLTFGVTQTTRRWFAFEQMKIRIAGHDGVVLRDVTVTGSAAAGIFVGDGASGFLIERATVRDSRADGIHMTDGVHDGRVVSPLVERSGDDGVAVVSYGTDAEPCRGITVTSPQVNGTTWGRGLSVVGGEDITYSDVSVSGSNAAGIYIAVEGEPYNTRSVRGVRVERGTVTSANLNETVDHGAVLVFHGRSSGESLSDTTVTDLTITDTSTTASRNVGIIAPDGGLAGVTLSNLVIEGGPAQTLTADADPASFSIENWNVDGQAFRAG